MHKPSLRCDFATFLNSIVIRQLNNTARKRNRNYLPDPKTLNGAKPDANWVSNFPSLPLTWLKPKYYNPSDTHWHYWGRPVSKSRQIQLSHIARNLELACAFFTWHLKYSLFDNRGHTRKYFTKDFQIPWLLSIYSVLMCLYLGLWTSAATRTSNLNKPSADSPIIINK